MFSNLKHVYKPKFEILDVNNSQHSIYVYSYIAIYPICIGLNVQMCIHPRLVKCKDDRCVYFIAQESARVFPLSCEYRIM